MRRTAGQEDFPVPRRGAFGQQVVQHRLPGRAGQRQYAAPAGLRREDDDLVVRPVDVVQPQRPDLAPAQAVAGDQQQHGVVAPPVRLTHVDHAEQAAHLLPRQGAGHVGEPVAPPQRHRAYQLRAAVPAQIQPPVEAGQRRGQMVPRRPPQASPALAAEREQVVRAQRRQLGRAHRSAAADQEVAKVASVVGYRRFGEPAITTQEPAIALDQLPVGRLVRRRPGGSRLPRAASRADAPGPGGPVLLAGPPGGGNSDTPADDRRGSPRRPRHREPGRFPALRAGTCRGEPRRARNPGTSARHSRARAASRTSRMASGPSGASSQRTSNSPFQNASCIAHLHDLCLR